MVALPYGKSRLLRSMALGPSEYMDIINVIEEQFPVDNWVMNDIHVWPLIRAQLVSQMDSFLNKKSAYRASPWLTALRNIGRSFDIIASFSKYMYAVISDRRHNDNIAGRKIDILFLSLCMNRVLIDSCFYNKLVDPLIELLDEQGFKSLVLEMTWTGEYYTPRYKSSRYIQAHLDYFLLKSKMSLAREKSVNFQLRRYDDFAVYLKTLNLNYSLTVPNIRSVQKEVALIRYIASFFKKIIIQTGVSVGMSTQYYGRAGMAMNLACRETGIMSVDIQHGMENDLHWAYGRWARVPEKGYELLHTVFLCWSDNEAKVIKKWNKKVEKYHRPVVVGNLWLKKWLDDGDDIVGAFDSKVSRVKQKHGKSIHILFTMQDETIPELILDAIKKSSDLCFWWIRCHPAHVEDRSNIRNVLNNRGYYNNVEVENASIWPLYALLRHMDIHVTGWSTTVIEAAVFNVPSIIVHEFGVELYAEQIKEGIVTCAYDSQELVDAIMTMGNKPNGLKRKHNNEATSDEDILLLFNQLKHAPN